MDELLGRNSALSYAQYRSLSVGMTLDAIRRSFGPGTNALERDGKVRALSYACEDATGTAVWLKLAFGDAGTLESWVLQGEAAKKA